MIRKIFILIISLFFIFGLFLGKAFAENKKKYFRITAYYSPLPNQNYYAMGNYRKEIIMNGRGIRGASGKRVFSGMLAAPKKYGFGTKIKLKGLGIGEVSDRGGAIVRAGKRNFKYDRIDIWCGHGGRGLQRAMLWGNRVIEGEIISKETEVTLDINTISKKGLALNINKKSNLVVKELSVKRKVFLNSPLIINSEKKEIKKKEIKKKDKFFFGPIKNSLGVKKLQKIFKTINLYHGEIDGKYSNIRKILLDFQLDNKIISKSNDIGAGYFGPKTRRILEHKYYLFLENKKEALRKQEIIRKKQEKIRKEQKELALKKYSKKIKSLSYIKFGDIGSKVRRLQIILKELGYFKNKDTAIFGIKTKQAIINYQISKKLIKNKNSKGAGILGPNTKKMLIKDLIEKEIKGKIIL